MTPDPGHDQPPSFSAANRLLARGLGLFFRLLYHEMAWTYDIVAAAVSVGKWGDWVRALLPYLSGPRILELGHGPGHLQTALAQRGLAPIGLDASRQMSRQAYRRLRKSGQTPRLVSGLAQQLPFPPACFDQVTATFPTEYIVALDTLKEIRRVLKPGGELVILPVAWITGQRPWDRLAAGLFRVTGQAPTWDERFIQPFIKAGFAVQVERIQRPDSLILLLRARPAE